MTRINLVDPSELHDQHLVAERREIRLLCANLVRTLNSKAGFRPSRIPQQFTLNTGHVYFFYNKGKYLYNRYNQLTQEMIMRGMKPVASLTFPTHLWPAHLFNDWQPTECDKQIVRDRIQLRLSQKPNWYRKTLYQMIGIQRMDRPQGTIFELN